MDKRFFKWVDKNSPSRHELAESRWLRPFRKWILASEYWRFTRRSVPRAIWAGMFVGIFLMIPGLQMIGATLVAVPLRANIPVAAAVTWVSNPVTTPFFLIAALEVGGILGFPTDFAAFMDLFGDEASAQRWLDWALSAAAPSMILGLFIIAFLTACVAYALSLVGWRLWVGRKWRQRQIEDQ